MDIQNGAHKRISTVTQNFCCCCPWLIHKRLVATSIAKCTVWINPLRNNDNDCNNPQLPEQALLLMMLLLLLWALLLLLLLLMLELLRLARLVVQPGGSLS